MLLIFFVPFFTIIAVATLGFLHNVYGLPYSPFKWAQERRRRYIRRQTARISALEHDLGYRPCSDDDCRSCKSWERELNVKGHPIWDNPALPAPPPMIPIDDLAKKAYDKDIALRTRRGTVSGGPR